VPLHFATSELEIALKFEVARVHKNAKLERARYMECLYVFDFDPSI
jgi:hypothetical protein